MTSEFVHLITSMVGSVTMNSLHDLMHVVTLMSSVEAHKNNKNESKARFLSKSLGGSNSVSPNHHLSTFANSANLGENEKENGGQSLEGIVKLKLLVSDVLWTFRLHLFGSVVRMVRAMVSIDHVIGVSASRHHFIE